MKPTIEIYESSYGRIIMGEDLAKIFKGCAKKEWRTNPFDEDQKPRAHWVEPELEKALETIMKKAASLGMDLIRL